MYIVIYIYIYISGSFFHQNKREKNGFIKVEIKSCHLLFIHLVIHSSSIPEEKKAPVTENLKFV
jgi:hypothetical protein